MYTCTVYIYISFTFGQGGKSKQPVLSVLSDFFLAEIFFSDYSMFTNHRLPSPRGQMWFPPVVSGTRLKLVWTDWRVTCANTAEEPFALTRVYKELSSDSSAAKYVKQPP